MYSKQDEKVFTDSMRKVNVRLIRENWLGELHIIGSVCPSCNATNFHDSWIDKNDLYQCPVCTHKIKKVTDSITHYAKAEGDCEIPC